MANKNFEHVFAKAPQGMDTQHPTEDWEETWPDVLGAIEKTMSGNEQRFYIRTADNRILSYPSCTEDRDLYSSFIDYFGNYTPYPVEVEQDKSGELVIVMGDSDDANGVSNDAGKWVVRFGKPDYMGSLFNGEYEIGFQEASDNEKALKLWEKLPKCYPVQRIVKVQKFSKVCNEVCKTLEDRNRDDSVVRTQYAEALLNHDNVEFHFTFGKVRIPVYIDLDGLSTKKVFTGLYKEMLNGTRQKQALRDYMGTIDDDFEAMLNVDAFITDWGNEEEKIENMANYDF